jgi:hypothetical protein
MPFTTSHPAIVLPLKQLWPTRFSLTGLMAGAVSPDLLYFLLADTTNRGFSHSWAGLVIFCLPAALIFAFVFHRLFKYRFIINMPWFIERRLSGLADSRFEVKTPAAWITLIGSILVGALSHFAWDSFTHPQGEMVQLIPLLSRPVVIFGLDRPICRWLQHLSTLWGGLFVLWFLFTSRHVPKATRNVRMRLTRRKIVFWTGGLVAAAACTFVMVWFYNGLYGWGLEDGYNYSLGFITAGLASWAGLFYYVCAYSLISRLVRRGVPIDGRGYRRQKRERDSQRHQDSRR